MHLLKGGPLWMQNLTSDLIALADVFASERLVTWEALCPKTKIGRKNVLFIP
jgi:hypothetical protein